MNEGPTDKPEDYSQNSAEQYITGQEDAAGQNLQDTEGGAGFVITRESSADAEQKTGNSGFKEKFKNFFKDHKVQIATAISFLSILVTPFASVALIHHIIPVAWDLLAIAGAVTAGFVSRNFLAKKQSGDNQEHQDNLIMTKMHAVREHVMETVMNHAHVQVPETQEHQHNHDSQAGNEPSEYLKNIPQSEGMPASDQMRTAALDREMENHLKEHAPDIAAHMPMSQAHAAVHGAIDTDRSNAFYNIGGASDQYAIDVAVEQQRISEQKAPPSAGKMAALVK